jgi:PTS system nitrogen regulatory IIA component
VSEKTIRRWIVDGKIPAYRIHQHYRFSRTEIENWVISHKLNTTLHTTKTGSLLPPIDKTKGGTKQFSLFRALHKGGVLHHIPGQTKEEVIRDAMKQIAQQLNLDAEVMTELLLDREKLMPTALNNGIGIPHTRDSLLNAHYDAVYVVYPSIPLPYGALDGQPVDTLFFLFACEDKRHLHLLAKIAHLSNQNDSRNFIKSRPSKEECLGFIKEWESQFANF